MFICSLNLLLLTQVNPIQASSFTFWTMKLFFFFETTFLNDQQFSIKWQFLLIEPFFFILVILNSAFSCSKGMDYGGSQICHQWIFANINHYCGTQQLAAMLNIYFKCILNIYLEEIRTGEIGRSLAYNSKHSGPCGAKILAFLAKLNRVTYATEQYFLVQLLIPCCKKCYFIFKAVYGTGDRTILASP